MAIKNLVPRLAERGKIKIGIRGEMKRSEGGKQFAQPRKLDHFIITTTERDESGRLMQDQELMEKFKPQNGDGKIRELPIRLLYNDPDLNFFTRYSCYVGASLHCSGDGIEAQRLDQKSQTWEKVPCPCPYLDAVQANGRAPGTNVKCKPYGKLQVILDGVERLGGVWTFATTSWNSVNSILSGLNMFSTITGGVLRWIPFWLRVAPKTVTVPGTGQVQKVFVVSLEYRGSQKSLADMALELKREQIEHRTRILQLEDLARRALEAMPTQEEVQDTIQEFFPEQVNASFEQPGGPEDDPRLRIPAGEGSPSKPQQIYIIPPEPGLEAAEMQEAPGPLPTAPEPPIPPPVKAPPKPPAQTKPPAPEESLQPGPEEISKCGSCGYEYLGGDPTCPECGFNANVDMVPPDGGGGSYKSLF